ncbi:gas vesicle protein GvpG [uncultured Thiohalocapsa sp.]|uniref:gas vesicle protein GvpG n=1 Tax=uncultured Thiohalocapsa sp. TaxID=768990 RepID=UPI0025D9AF04|nr:gas vesicle protein GvpG [uncultured Thiohalocapsa sp.]
MLLIDDILLSPYKGLLWIFEEIHNNAVEELEGEAERIRNELTDLYMMFEAEQIDEAEFDRREAALLDRLDELEAEDGEDDDAAEAAPSEDLGDVSAGGDIHADAAAEPSPDGTEGHTPTRATHPGQASGDEHA